MSLVVEEITNKFYRVVQSNGRWWTVLEWPHKITIQNESGQPIDPAGVVGEGLLRAIRKHQET